MKVGDTLYYLKTTTKDGEIWKVVVDKIKDNFVFLLHGTKRLRPIYNERINDVYKIFQTEQEAMSAAQTRIEQAIQKAQARIDFAESRKQKTIRLAQEAIDNLKKIQPKIVEVPKIKKTHFSKTVQ